MMIQAAKVKFWSKAKSENTKKQFLMLVRDSYLLFCPLTRSGFSSQPLWSNLKSVKCVMWPLSDSKLSCVDWSVRHSNRIHWPVLLLQVIKDPLQLSLLLCLHGDEDLGGAAGLAERRALVQRLAVVLDQHVLVIAADTHTSNIPTNDTHT